MKRKYGPKASDKIGQTMHEFKLGKLKSGGSGKKVKSRKQAIAIGLSQARRAGGKVPPPPRHATRKAQLDEQFGGYVRGRIDDEVRRYISLMRPGQEIDARGMSRALGRGGGGFTPIEIDHALERAVNAGVAVTDDGRWFGPAGSSTQGTAVHATRKRSTAQLDREIAEVLAGSQRGDVRRDHATMQGATRTLFAVEIDPSEFEDDRKLPQGAAWREDLVNLADAELGLGRTYRRSKNARNSVIEWSGGRGAVGRLLDWMEGAPGITRYAEIFE